MATEIEAIFIGYKSPSYLFSKEVLLWLPFNCHLKDWSFSLEKENCLFRICLIANAHKSNLLLKYITLSSFFKDVESYFGLIMVESSVRDFLEENSMNSQI